MNKRFSREQISDELKKYAKKVKDADLDAILEKEKEIEDKFVKKGPLGRYLNDLKLLVLFLKDYITKRYTRVPWGTIATIVGSLIYVLSPIDLIPDFIPGIGYLDDAAVFFLCLNMIESDLRKYETWREEQKEFEEIFDEEQNIDE